MKYVVLLLLSAISFNASSTVFSLGDGSTWKRICLGVHDELNQQGAIASCTILLLGYQVGAVEQAKTSGTPVSLCRSLNPNTLPTEFVEFINSDEKYAKMDVLDVLHMFTKGNECGI